MQTSYPGDFDNCSTTRIKAIAGDHTQPKMVDLSDRQSMNFQMEEVFHKMSAVIYCNIDECLLVASTVRIANHSYLKGSLY